MILSINNLTINYDTRQIIQNFNLEVNNGDIIGLFLPSGSGKTTLLNYISENFQEKCKISYAYQDLRLIDHLSVEKNLEIPLLNQNPSGKKEIKQEIENMLEKLNLISKKSMQIKKLSGGEKQRVSLARALLFPSELVLLDECFNSLDEKEKNNAVNLTKNILTNQKRSAIIVSHEKNILDTMCTKIITNLIS